MQTKLAQERSVGDFTVDAMTGVMVDSRITPEDHGLGFHDSVQGKLQRYVQRRPDGTKYPAFNVTKTL